MLVWGSGSKAVAYLTSLGLRDEIAAVVDISPHKSGRSMAGTGHRIEPPEHLRTLRPDVVVVMNGLSGRDRCGARRARPRTRAARPRLSRRS
ncbi:MAG: hypothetical protein R3D25_17735 [Geminicoccaceae bacterium]